MLKALLPATGTIHTVSGEYQVRYSLNSFLYLEMICGVTIDELLGKGVENWSVDEMLHLLRAGLCHLPENDKAVSDRAFEFIVPTIAELGEAVALTDLPLLRYELATAVLEGFPKRGGTDNAPSDPHREQHLRSMYVDVIGRPEEEFWRSTYGEIIDRSESWAETKGLKEPVPQMQMYDDD